MTDSARDCVAAISTETASTPFGKALSQFFPPGTPRHIPIAFFGYKANWQQIKDWKRGKAGVPEWALDLMRQRVETGLAYLNQTKIGPGQKAGTENLRKWHARKKD